MPLEEQLSQAIYAQNQLTQVVSQKLTAIEQAMTEFINDWGIAGYTVIEVGAHKAFDNLQQAWDSLLGKMLKRDVLIKVDDGIYRVERIDCQNQPFAHRIRIAGNVANPSACQICFTPNTRYSSDGWIISNVRGLQIAGFTLVGETTPQNWTHRCLRIERGAQVMCDPGSLRISGGRCGLEITENAHFIGEAIQITQCAEYGVAVGDAACAVLPRLSIDGVSKSTVVSVPSYIDASGTSITPQGLYAHNGAQCSAPQARISQVAYGVQVTHNAVVDCPNIIIDQVEQGIRVIWNGVCWCNGSPASARAAQGWTPRVSNADQGYFVEFGGALCARYALAENCRVGFAAYVGGILVADESSVKNCQYGFNTLAGHIEARNTSSKAVNCTSLYNPPSNDVADVRNSLIRF